MKFYQETTVWDSPTANHVYLLNDSKSKMIGYVRAGTNSVFTFKKPIGISMRGRKFMEVANTFGYTVKKTEPINPQWQVQGSKGDTYIVERTENGLTCTCSGFKFRGACKHVKELELA